MFPPHPLHLNRAVAYLAPEIFLSTFSLMLLFHLELLAYALLNADLTLRGLLLLVEESMTVLMAFCLWDVGKSEMNCHGQGHTNGGLGVCKLLQQGDVEAELLQ
jgi:hypothetical protein